MEAASSKNCPNPYLEDSIVIADLALEDAVDEAEYVRARVEAAEVGPRRGKVPKMDCDEECRLLEEHGTMGADLL